MEQQYTYQYGFNSGYLMAKFKRALLVKLAPSLTKKHDFIIGLSDGKLEYELEMQKGMMHEIEMLRNNTNQGFEREL